MKLRVSRDFLALLRGVFSILVAASAPWVAWATEQSTLRGAIVVSCVASIGSTYTWINSALSDRIEAGKVRRAAIRASLSAPPPSMPIGPEEKTPDHRGG
jgi:hypothetical protein